MSELQAAIALLSLRDYEKNVARNIRLRGIYTDALLGVDGVDVESLHGVSNSNNCSMIIRVDEERFGVPRDTLMGALEAENVLTRRYFQPGSHRVSQFSRLREWHLPHTDKIQRILLALPLGSRVDEDIVHRISGLISEVHQHPSAVLNELR
jgi:dTDP-4-amino-4,6-dideoxygalactose transaminase